MAEQYTVTVWCMLVVWAWVAVLELYGNMSGIRMWGLSRAGGAFFVLY